VSIPVPHSSSDTPVDPEAVTQTRAAVSQGDPVTTDVRAPSDRALPFIPGFKVIRWLGGGGMGEVYEVVDEKFGVTFALKMVRADRVSPAFTIRFHREFRALMTLDHPHVVRVFNHDDVGGRPYFTMRFVRGGTLADRLVELRADPRRAVRLLVKVIDAIDYLHRQGQVHRDLKPTNILLDEAGEPYLSDFGLVKDLSDVSDPDEGFPATQPVDGSTAPDDETRTAPPASRQQTRTGAKVGTYAYMSPEQASGDIRRVGPTSDVWALGVILYEIFTGARPERDVQNPPPGIDLELDRIVARCLTADPALRYPSAALLATDLRAWLDPVPVQPVKRRRWTPIALVASAVIVGTGITLALLKPRPRPTDGPDEWRAWARTELREGRAVTLVAKDGTSAPGFRFVAGAGRAKVEQDPGGWLNIHTTGTTLAEFLDDPGISNFVFQGEFRGDFRAGPPLAGLYLASRRVAGDGGDDWHYQLEFRFDDNPLNLGPAVPVAPPPPPRAVAPNVQKSVPNSKKLKGPPPIGTREVRFHGSRFNGQGDIRESAGSWTIENDRPEPDGPWRRLAIRARDDTFAVVWDDEDEQQVTNPQPSALARMQNRGAIEWLGPPLHFTARGGLGVTVEGGSVAIRDLTITPSK
jgi:serine/threonine protein kinase